MESSLLAEVANRYKVQWVNCCQFELLIPCMHLVCFRFCLLCNKPESVRHCLWRNQHHDTIHSTRYLKFMMEVPIWRLQCTWLFIWGQIYIHKNQKPSPHHGHSDGDVMPLFISPHGFRQCRGLHQVPGGGYAAQDQKGSC